ncbi:MAG: hypothetical protein WC974_08200 [Thermoplasmata archaeon]
MKPEGHLDKAHAFEDRAKKWETERDAPSVIEDIFDATVHYVAYGINKKYGKDIDSHALQKHFLREQKEDAMYVAYENIERIRISSVYGGAWNGDRIKKALEFLGEIKKWIELIGKPPA